MLKKLMPLLLALCLLSGCGAPTSRPQRTQPEGVAVTFTDDLGRCVSVGEPKRVAALIGSFADIWCLAGGRNTLVAAANDTWTGFELNLPGDVVNLGGVKTPDLERLLAAQPDLVLASSNTAAQVELLPVLEGAGLNVAYFKVTNFEEYLRMLEVCTQITGEKACYEQYGQALEERIGQAKARADGSAPRVLYVRATGSSCKVKNSEDSVLGEMLADLGCVNIADGEHALLEELSLEAIIREDPEHIFLVMQGADPAAARQTLERTLLSNPAWNSLTAVREGRCHVMDDKLYNLKPNARWGEAYEKLADILYPQKTA